MPFAGYWTQSLKLALGRYQPTAILVCHCDLQRAPSIFGGRGVSRARRLVYEHQQHHGVGTRGHVEVP